MDKPVSYYAFQMLYWTGIREGELLALTPADFDFERGTVKISKTYQRLKGKDVIIQSRMFMMYGVEDSDKLHFATAANKIGNGLDEQLEFFVREHPDTKLIIIDTMQKIREVGGEVYSYASDYEIIGRLPHHYCRSRQRLCTSRCILMCGLRVQRRAHSAQTISTDYQWKTNCCPCQNDDSGLQKAHRRGRHK